jgi:hypothetical protein
MLLKLHRTFLTASPFGSSFSIVVLREYVQNAATLLLLIFKLRSTVDKLTRRLYDLINF